MISQILDRTDIFNASGKVQLDISNWDYAVLQIINPTGTVTFNATNDSNSVEGAVEGNALSAINWVSIQGINLTTGTGVTTIAATSLIKFNVVGRYVKFESIGQTVGKMIIYLSKIS